MSNIFLLFSLEFVVDFQNYCYLGVKTNYQCQILWFLMFLSIWVPVTKQVYENAETGELITTSKNNSLQYVPIQTCNFTSDCYLILLGDISVFIHHVASSDTLRIQLKFKKGLGYNCWFNRPLLCLNNQGPAMRFPEQLEAKVSRMKFMTHNISSCLTGSGAGTLKELH